MKKLLTFILFTLALIALTCLYLWYQLHTDVTSIPYVPHTDWSEPQIVPSMSSRIYDAKADQQGRLHLVWLESTSVHQYQVRYTILHPDGKPLGPAQAILTHSEIQDLALTLSGDHIHLFWVGVGPMEKADLIWSELNTNGEILQQKTLLTNTINLAEDLTAVPLANDGHFLAWTDLTGDGRLLKTLQISPTRTIHTATITSPTETVITPQIAVDESDQIHLTWRKEIGPDQYQLQYQSLSAKGIPQGSPRVMDQGSLGLAAISAKDGRVYMVWEKTNPDFVQSQNLYGAIVSQEGSTQPVTPILLSKPDSSNFAPALGWDEANHLRLVYAKWKRDYKSLVSQSYGADFTETISKTRWIYPQAMEVAQTQITADPSQRLFVTCLESRLGNQHTLHYFNSFEMHKTTPWQIIGLNSRDLDNNVKKSLVYILFGPALNLFVFTFYFLGAFTVILISFILSWVRKQFDNTRWEALAHHFYLNLAVICLLQIPCLWGFLNLLQFDWPMQLIQNHFWMIYGLSTLAIFAYSWINRVHKTEVMFASILCFGWIYWVWIIQLTLNMMNLNFVVPPMI